MKALVCEAFGPPESLVIKEMPSPPLVADSVKIHVRAAGVNFPDTLVIQGKYQFKPSFPFAPGGEVAGEVIGVGAGVSHVAPGTRVLGMTLFGGFAEETVVPASSCYPLPDNMSYESAAGFTMTYGTSYHALKQRANLRAGETLLVLGAAGGVGLAAVELGKAMGARVIAAASTEEKLQLARQAGADMLLDYTKLNLKEALKSMTAGQGVDVVYDPVGGAYAEPAFRAMAWGGRYLVVGFAAGPIPNLPLNLPLLKGATLVGVFWGEFTRREPQANHANMLALFDLYRSGQLKPHVCTTFALEEGGQAIRMLMDRQALGKIILRVA
jgi:NADPH:quinone reductase